MLDSLKNLNPGIEPKAIPPFAPLSPNRKKLPLQDIFR
ncbi:MAG: hypothetical protein ACI9OD_000004 [Limisphaerales bacterium]|jgi:hypothetical protein